MNNYLAFYLSIIPVWHCKHFILLMFLSFFFLQNSKVIKADRWRTMLIGMMITFRVSLLYLLITFWSLLQLEINCNLLFFFIWFVTLCFNPSHIFQNTLYSWQMNVCWLYIQVIIMSTPWWKYFTESAFTRSDISHLLLVINVESDAALQRQKGPYCL